MTERGKAFRQLIDEAVLNSTNKKLILSSEREIGLLFSGGIDSLGLFLSMKSQGIPFRCFTYYVTGHEDRDLLHARRTCEIYGIELEEVEHRKRGYVSAIALAKAIMSITGSCRKTHIESIFPYVDILKALMFQYEYEYCPVLMIGSQSMFAGSRGASIRFRNNPNKEEFAEYVLEKWKDPNTSGMLQAKRFFHKFGVDVVFPYREDIKLPMFTTQYTWQELNTPKWKQLLYEAFQEEIDRHDLYRKPQNAHLNVRDYLAELFKIKSSSGGQKFYRDLWKETSLGRKHDSPVEWLILEEDEKCPI